MVRRFGIILAMLVLMALLFPGGALAANVPGQSPEPQGTTCQAFPVTGHALCGELRMFWQRNGGLPVFGYPLTDEFDEVNPDTYHVYRVQYLERQRFELHPENAGTVYHVLIGRVGAQMLERHGRDWMTFPKASPSAAHYFAVTGHAIAPEFWPYWSSHGLDFGDPGISMRESLLLFGYPLSEPAMETNADGHTVLTQWFERAAFEYHPNNPPAYRVLLRRLGAELLDTHARTVVEGLNFPRGLAHDSQGALYVTDQGIPPENGGDACVELGEGEEAFEYCFANTASIVKVWNGTKTIVASGLPGTLSDVVVSSTGRIFVLTGLGGNPTEIRDVAGDLADGYGYLLEVHPGTNTWSMVADIAGYEVTANPDGGAIDTNPFGLLMTSNGFLVADAGANALVHVTMAGVVSTFAVFPPQMVEAPPFLGMPEGTEMPMQSVPTSVARGPDGAYYVSELPGFPFEIGAARIWRVHDANGDGDALDAGETTVYATGFTNVLDIAFDALGRMYVLQIFNGWLLEAEDPEFDGPFTGSLILVESDGSRTVVMSDGLVAPLGLTLGWDGAAYVGHFGLMPGMGAVLNISFVAD